MIGPISRIILRVIAGIMIGYGLPSDWVNQFANDPDVLHVFETVFMILITHVETLAGVLLWTATEIFYVMAKRLGWRT